MLEVIETREGLKGGDPEENRTHHSRNLQAESPNSAKKNADYLVTCELQTTNNVLAISVSHTLSFHVRSEIHMLPGHPVFYLATLPLDGEETLS